MNAEQIIEYYYGYKWWLSIIFDLESKKYLKDPKLMFDIKVLEALKEIVETYTQQGFFSPQIKDNIYRILVAAREIKDEYRIERTNLIGEMISLLNCQLEDKSEIFYQAQMCMRTGNKRYSLISGEQLAEHVNHMIYNDFVVVRSHDESVTEEEFEEYYLSSLKDNQHYYENINMILSECPHLFKNQTFYNRVLKVLNVNSKKFNRMSKKTKKLIKASIANIKD